MNPYLGNFATDGSQVALPGYVSQTGFFNNLIVANDSYSAFVCGPDYQYLSGAPPVVVNSDVINSGGRKYGGWCTSPAGTGNISADPKFKNPASGDFHLQTGSPAIDAGFNAALGLLATDLDGNPRIQNATGKSVPVVDMGAYEVTGAPESRSPSQTTLTAQAPTVFYGQSVSQPPNEGYEWFFLAWNQMFGFATSAGRGRKSVSCGMGGTFVVQTA